MRYVVDTWAPDYGTSRDEQLAEAVRPVDPDVEVRTERWVPVDPDPGRVPTRPVTFVDGVRRIDARIWILDDPGSPDTGSDDPFAAPGDGSVDGPGLDHAAVCATVAAGAVRCSPDRAEVQAVLVDRSLFTAAPHADPLDLGTALHYRVRPVPVASDDALYLAVHNHMASVEHRLSDELDEPGLVVFDGPLGPRNGADHAGYVKTQHVQYLERPEHQRVIGRLEPGQRTPLFHLGGDLANWSWYLRLPGPRSHSMSGVVRVELPGLGSIDDAVQRADEISRLLPRFASEPHKDTRAPQNLYPIAGLERELRRRLGDPALIDRALRRRSGSTPEVQVAAGR